MKFCTLLFHVWLHDYREYVNKLKEKTMTQSVYQYNECVDKNIEDMCLPIDYFIERIVQLGLITDIVQIKELIFIMGEFDNPGIQSMENCGENKVLSFFEKNFVNKKTIFNDNFKMINKNNKEAERYLRNHLPNGQFENFDRISLT